MRIAINLATRPYADLGPAIHRLRIGMGVLVLLCLGLGLGLHAVHTRAQEARAREHMLDGRLNRVSNERQGYIAMMHRPDNARLLSQTQMLNQIFDEKAFSWTLAMENLETVLPGGVQVTTLEPIRDKTGQITLHLRVVGPQNLAVDLVRNLEHSQRFLQPRIVGENAEAEGNGANQNLQPVSETNRFDFDILADYNPPASVERKQAGASGKPISQPPGADAAPTHAPHAGRRMVHAPDHAQRGMPRHAGRKPNPGQAQQPGGAR